MSASTRAARVDARPSGEKARARSLLSHALPGRRSWPTGVSNTPANQETSHGKGARQDDRGPPASALRAVDVRAVRGLRAGVRSVPPAAAGADGRARDPASFCSTSAPRRRSARRRSKMYVAAIKFLYGVDARPTRGGRERSRGRRSVRRCPTSSAAPRSSGSSRRIESTKYRAIVMTAYGAGLRISEVCGLRRRRHRQQAHAHPRPHGKGGRDRYVPAARAGPARRCDATGRPSGPTGPLLFPGQHAGHAASSTRRCSDHLAGGGQEGEAHQARHAARPAPHASPRTCSSCGTDIRVIQMLLGHALDPHDGALHARDRQARRGAPEPDRRARHAGSRRRIG